MSITAMLAGDLGLFADAIWSAATALTGSARRSRAGAVAGTSASILAGENAMRDAAPAWYELEAAGGAATPFQTFTIAERAAEVHLRRGETPCIAVVLEGERPVVVLPAVIGRWNGLKTARFLGDPLIQYGDVVADAEATDAHIEAALRAIAGHGASFVYFRKVRSDARIAPVLARMAGTVAEHQAPFVDVPAPPMARAAYLKELRRYRRRLAEIGEVRFEIQQGAAAVAAIREALDIKRCWLAGRAMPSSVIGDGDWEAAIIDLARQDRGSARFCVARLSVAGRTAAIEIGLVHGRNWYAFLGALTPEFAKNGPGHVQMAETIEHCRSGNIATYDLLAPADAYKRLLAHGAVTVRDHAAAMKGSGWAGVLAAHALPTAKHLFATGPWWLRRMLSGFQRK